MNFWGAVVDIAGMITFLLYAFGLLGGTCYLVINEGWSKWWFVLTTILISAVKFKTDTLA